MNSSIQSMQQAMDTGLLWPGREGQHSKAGGLSSQLPLFDQLLPEQGWPRHALVEIQHSRPGLGELSLVMPTLAKLRDRKSVV